ncbi:MULTISPECIES: LysR substrate-binding domain-containing protein [unclassified Acinetobacter]|uniref:LysR substrate-binding domain-containing protein n=1 Tax=unclassified Acinetobacter TaxID=196816 RepID=UPI00190C2CEC|nr:MULTISPECIES: LysR substrate-binding domain-containing protein [unclassified Acinetobacter]MBK0063265.1 LysR family transcriptional regulator [Acinetobacter sp. S55]MBK0066823.1 LysR family transcriptional regulator [Acinetobacter sp. S54]
MSLEIRWIEDLLTLEQERSISKAAERRFVSQSAFTRRIQQLEQALGFPILDRDSRHLEFTDAGQILLATAKSIEDQLQATLALLNNLNKTKEVTVRFAVVHSLSSTFFSNFIQIFPEHLQGFKIELIAANVGEGFKLLKEGACDFLIGYNDHNKLSQINRDIIDYLKLGQTDIIPVSIINKDGEAKFDINKNFPLLSYSKNAYLRNLVDQVIINQLEYRILYETDHANNLKDFVMQGAGIAWLPRITIEDELSMNKVKILADNKFSIQQEIFILRNKLNKDASLQQIWAFLKNVQL